MDSQIELAMEPQWKVVQRMLSSGPKTTADFINTPGLAAEYRRAISDLRRKLAGDGIKVLSERQREGSWKYWLESAPKPQDLMG